VADSVSWSGFGQRLSGAPVAFPKTEATGAAFFNPRGIGFLTPRASLESRREGVLRFAQNTMKKGVDLPRLAR